MYIPYGRQWIEDDDVKAVVDTLKSDYLTTGPKVKEFEQSFAEYTGAKYAVAVSSGTAALHCACHCTGIKKGDEVITTPITFAASANSILYCGGTPVFADIDPETYNIDTDKIESLITKKTKAILPVDFAGQPCDLEKIKEIAKKNGLIIIEDASHALGADYKKLKIGSISDITTFSFHPVKHITSGEGGMVTTNDEETYKRLKLFRSHGITRNREEMEKDEGEWYYEQIELGYNYRISDIHCALGISQLKKIEKFIQRRREIAKKYDEAFSGIEWLKIPKQREGCNSSYHLYVLRLKNRDRKKVFDKLRNDGIGVNVHYLPVYKLPYYQKTGYKNVKCIEAEKLYNEMISIPIFPKMTDDEQEYVIERIMGSSNG